MKPALQEADLREHARLKHKFHVWGMPLIINEEVWWCVVLEFTDDARKVPLVDARIQPRRWKQTLALIRFILRCCGDDYIISFNPKGVDYRNLTTKGE
jgi:hypothetical protein